MNILGLTLVSMGLLGLTGCIAPEPGYYGGGPAYYSDSPRYYGGGGVYIGGFDERRDGDRRDGDRRDGDRGRHEGHDR
jgi:hypothetical protein